MSGITQVLPGEGDATDGHGAPHRRSFLSLGGATLLVGGVAGCAAAARPAGTADRGYHGPSRGRPDR